MKIKRVSNVSDLNKIRDEQRILEHNGITYNWRDPIGIKGEKGPFTFSWWDISKDGKKTVAVYWINHGFRFFYVERVKEPKKRKSKAGRISLCDEHPTYGAVRRPRTDCKTCWDAYESKHGTREKVKPQKKKGLNLVKVEAMPDEEI